MKHSRFLPILLAVAACGGSIESHEDVIEAQLDLVKEATSILKTVKDVKTAEAAKPKLDALGKRGKEIQAAMSKIKGEPDPKLQKKMEPEMSKALSDFMAAQMAIPNDPEIHRIIGEVDFGK